MKIVIEMKEHYWNEIQELTEDEKDFCQRVISEGTPLPKHGRLIDADWIEDNCPYYYSDEDARLCYAVNDVDNAPTIIEADKSESAE